MGSRMVNIPAIFAQHFDDIIHTPSLIKGVHLQPQNLRTGNVPETIAVKAEFKLNLCVVEVSFFFLHENEKSHRYIKYSSFSNRGLGDLEKKILQ